MSTAANGASKAWSIATVRAEKPQAGASGVPFMKRIVSCSPIASAIASRMGLDSLLDMGGSWLWWLYVAAVVCAVVCAPAVGARSPCRSLSTTAGPGFSRAWVFSDRAWIAPPISSPNTP